jgi:ABC-type nickel/cobalt efflux system permease component RcnA
MGNRRWLEYGICTGLLLAGLFLIPDTSPAHPLGNFSISHYTGIQIAQDSIELRYVLDMAEIPTFQELQDTGLAPEVEHPRVQGYLAQKTEVLKAGLLLEVNGQGLALQVVSSEILFPPGAGGLPTLKLGVVYRTPLDPAPADIMYSLYYRDGNFPGRAGWQEIIARTSSDITLIHSSVSDTDRSRALTDYPTNLLNSPPQVLEAQMLFRQAIPHQAIPHTVVAANGAPASFTLPFPPGSGVSRQPLPTPALPLQANRQATPRNAFTELVTTPQLNLGIICLALAGAVGLGAFHALEPGHGKTVVAAYLVGTRGTARHALSLGLIVTATHTAGVYLLGVVTLYASRYVVPERLYPWLGVLSGLIIAGVGCVLFLRRYAGGETTHTHGHTHGHGHIHAHGHTHVHTYAHTHGHAQTHNHSHHHGLAPDQAPVQAHGVRHHHHRQPGETVSFRELLALGITGGIVPCPAALVVLLSAIALQRIGFGLLLIIAFSVGLAAVLIAIGLLMVYARRFMSRFQGEGPLITRWLPLTSAATITVLGTAMVMQALVAAGVLHIRL